VLAHICGAVDVRSRGGPVGSNTALSHGFEVFSFRAGHGHHGLRSGIGIVVARHAALSQNVVLIRLVARGNSTGLRSGKIVSRSALVLARCCVPEHAGCAPRYAVLLGGDLHCIGS